MDSSHTDGQSACAISLTTISQCKEYLQASPQGRQALKYAVNQAQQSIRLQAGFPRLLNKESLGATTAGSTLKTVCSTCCTDISFKCMHRLLKQLSMLKYASSETCGWYQQHTAPPQVQSCSYSHLLSARQRTSVSVSQSHALLGQVTARL